MRTETRGRSSVVQDSTTPNPDVEPTSLPPVGPAEGSKGGSSIHRRSLPRLLCFTLIAFVGLVGDLWSKYTVFKWLGLRGQHEVWKGTFLWIPVDFQFATTFNLGALWGMGQGQTWLFASLSIVAVFALAYFLATGQAIESWCLTIASGLLLAGTLGNLYDRLGLHGHTNENGTIYGVRDFLDFVFFNGGFHWATFNLADSYLVTGAILLIWQSFTQPVTDPAISSAAPQSCP